MACLSSDDASCSDCKMELIEKRWTQLLVTWINTCVTPKNKIKCLDLSCLVNVLDTYKEDLCADDLDVALLGIEDIELFTKYKYPMLRLRYLSEPKDFPKKLYTLTSILLFYCCTNSQTGAVEQDICTKLAKVEQELIINFCENLCEMETTINNVDCAIRGAYEHVLLDRCQTRTNMSKRTKAPLAGKRAKTIGDGKSNARGPILTFKSSVTVMPSATSEMSTYSKSDSSEFTLPYRIPNIEDLPEDKNVTIYNVKSVEDDGKKLIDKDVTLASESSRCQDGCACTRCSTSGPCCGDPGATMGPCKESKPPLPGAGDTAASPPKLRIMIKKRSMFWWVLLTVLGLTLVATVIIIIVIAVHKKGNTAAVVGSKLFNAEDISLLTTSGWRCERSFCQKVNHMTTINGYYSSLSRCTLLCARPQLWPQPIGITQFSSKIVGLSTSKLEYKFESIPSVQVHQYIGEAFKLFISELVKLEKIDTSPHNASDLDLIVKTMHIVIEIDSDIDPRMRYNTDESYTLKVDTVDNKVVMKVSSGSFCGVRHGLETLSQIILLDQTTGLLITLTDSLIKDSPSYKYRGLMLDTARNYIPVSDLIRTIDAMATVKLNTFHWRISDASSFPFYIEQQPELFENGAYDKSMIYTRSDIASLVKRAGFRGVRVLIEVAAPGPVGRAWSWSPDASCSRKRDNNTCDNILCTRLEMEDSVFDTLQKIYSYIIKLTKVDDVFHLSDGLFSLARCSNLIDDREGFLLKALVYGQQPHIVLWPSLYYCTLS